MKDKKIINELAVNLVIEKGITMFEARKIVTKELGKS